MLFRGLVEAKNNWPPFLAKDWSQGTFELLPPNRCAHVYIRITNSQLLRIHFKGGHTYQQVRIQHSVNPLNVNISFKI